MSKHSYTRQGVTSTLKGLRSTWCCDHCGDLQYTYQGEPVPTRDCVRSGDALRTQVGGDHYKGFAIQPIEFIHANKIPFLEGNVIKYVVRWKQKGGIADLEKAKHYIDLLIRLENPGPGGEKA